MLGHKFAFFLGIELGLFPAFCGVVMDLCTLPLFSGTNFIGSRWRFACHAPFTFFLLHWFAGTICMFQLSRFVAVIRTVVRPGVIWFVRDPNDPDFQPLNEILTRTVLIQLRKLAVGTLMYTVMIVSVIGGFTIALYVLEATVGNIGYALSNGMLGGGLRVPEGVFRVLPLNWELRRESYDMAFDVVLFHAVYRIILSGLLHRALGMRLLSSWFVWSSIAFRVSEFMLGTKRQEEEDRDGGYLRVPNHDRVPVIPGLQMMVPAERGQGLFGRDGETEAEGIVSLSNPL
jgi:E3 ubiquitin-protein ligase DOA10